MGILDRLFRAPPVAAIPEQRADAVTLADIPDGGWSPALTATPAPIRWLTQSQRQAVASTGIGRRIVYAPPTVALGRAWEVRDGDDRDVAGDLDKRLGLRAELRDAAALARQDGVAWLLMVVRGVDDLTRPLPPGPHDVVRVHALSYSEATPIAWDNDPRSARFGEPLTLLVQMLRDGAQLSLGTVHRSHLVRVCGLTLDPTQDSAPDRSGSDMSAVEAYWPYLADLDLTGQSLATITKNMATPWIKTATQHSAMAGEKREDARSRWTRLRRAMGVFGLVPLSSGDEMGVLSMPLSGVRDVAAVQYERITSVEGAPVEWLTGMRVGGLGADDAGKMELVRQFIAGYRDEAIEPALREVYDVALGPSDTRTIVWPALDEPSALDVAQAALVKAQASAARVAAAITTPDEEREHLSGEGPGDLPRVEYVEPEGEASDGEIAALAGRLAPVREGDDAVPVAVAPAGVESVQETALNGAQIASAKDIVLEVAAGSLPRDSGVAMLMRFFSLSQSEADGIMGTVGRGFVPASIVSTPRADSTEYAVPEARKGIE